MNMRVRLKMGQRRLCIRLFIVLSRPRPPRLCQSEARHGPSETRKPIYNQSLRCKEEAPPRYAHQKSTSLAASK